MKLESRGDYAGLAMIGRVQEKIMAPWLRQHWIIRLNHFVNRQHTVYFAGMVAEARFTGHYCQRGAQQDLQTIKRLLCDRAGSPSQYERLQRRLLNKTEHLLHDPEYALAVKMIANELLLKTTISGRAVTHLFLQATK